MRRSANYVVIGSDLYRKAASTGTLMKCILRSEGLQLRMWLPRGIHQLGRQSVPIWILLAHGRDRR
jgi:hypothetical protein